MPGIHELMRGMPPQIFVIMVALPLGMTALAIAVGWYARSSNASGSPKAPHAAGRANDPFYAGLTMAVVPFAFALLMLWGRFG